MRSVARFLVLFVGCLYMQWGLRVRFVHMTKKRVWRHTMSGVAAIILAAGIGGCTGMGNGDPAAQGPTPGGNAIDTRTTGLPGSVMPSIDGAGNGGGVSGGGAGAGSFGGGR